MGASGPLYERCAVIGIGLIGASFALATKRAGAIGHVVGVARSEQTRADALAVGAADEVSDDPVGACGEADLVYLATPVGAMPGLLSRIAGSLRPAAIVTDAGSTKVRVVAAARASLPAHVVFIGGHPLAGSERSGPAAARSDLFRDQTYFLTPSPRTPPEACRRLRALLQAIGARVVELEPERHDALLASTSHLPHLVAAALAGAVADLIGAEPAAGPFIGKGFADTTRIACGPTDVWRDILLDNAQNVAQGLERLMADLEHWRQALRASDGTALQELLERGRQARKGLVVQ